MTRMYVEAWVFGRVVVDCESGRVEALELTPLPENVRGGEACIPVDPGDEDDASLPAAEAIARRLAASADLSAVPWRIVA